MEDNAQLVARVATFFLLVSIGLLILFAGSVAARQTQFLLLLVGLTTGLISYSLYRRAPKPPPSDRFSGLRKARERRQKRLEEKRQKREQKKK